MDNQKYFFLVVHCTNPANLLEEDIREKVKTNFKNAILIDKDEFLKLLDTQLFTCNHTHKRCRPLELRKGSDPLSKEEYVHFARTNGTILLQGRFLAVEKDFSEIKKTEITEDALRNDGWKKCDDVMVSLEKKLDNKNPINDEDSDISLIIHHLYNEPKMAIQLGDIGMLNFSVSSFEELKEFESKITFFDPNW